MSLKKKFLSLTAAAVTSFSLIFGAPATASASAADLIGAAIQIGAESAALNAEINARIRHFNETEAGRQELYNSFRKEHGVCEDAAYNAMLDRVMANLTKGASAVDKTVKDKPYLYFISNDENVNAACSMGRVMMVNVGTFKQIKNEDEIAAIVGHEMGHGQKDHVAKGQKKALQKYVMANLAGTAVSGTVGGGALTSLMTKALLNQSVAHGSRKFESEADLCSLDYMLHTNYNPGACAAVMQKFAEMDKGSKRSGLENFFNPNDHPESDKRRDAYVKKLFEYSGKHVTAANGIVTINKKTFIKVAPSADMSGAERSYFVLGNLAVAFHKGLNKQEATVQNGTVMLGNQPIITPLEGDEPAQVIADRLNEIK